MSRRKRGKLAITESILRVLEEGPELKTNIAYRSKLDSRTISTYIPLISKLALVKVARSGEYHITRKGYDFLKQYSKIKKYDNKG